MKITVFLITLFSLILLSLTKTGKTQAYTYTLSDCTITQDSGCDLLNIDFHHDNTGTTWTLVFKIKYYAGTTRVRTWPGTSTPKKILVPKGSTSVLIDSKRGWGTYSVNWSTTCLDPTTPIINYDNYNDGIYRYSASINVDPRDNRNHGGIGPGNGLGTVPWRGNDTDYSVSSYWQNVECFPCQPKTCADMGYECGSFTTCNGNGGTKTVDCGGCSGTKVCSSHQCIQNFGCNNNGQCVQKQCQLGNNDCYAKNTCGGGAGDPQGNCDGPISGTVYTGGSRYGSGAKVTRNPRGAGNNDTVTSNNQGNYGFNALITDSNHDITLKHSNGGAPPEEINSCVWVPNNNGNWTRTSINVPNTNVDFNLVRNTYSISGRLLWDPDGNGQDPFKPYNAANDGKRVTVKVQGGNNDLTNNSGNYSIGGNITDADGEKYTVGVCDEGCPNSQESIKPIHQVIDTNGNPTGGTAQATISCSNVNNFDFIIAPKGWDIFGNLFVDDDDGRFDPGDTPYPASTPSETAIVSITDRDKNGLVNSNGGYSIAGNQRGRHTVRLQKTTLRQNYSIIGTRVDRRSENYNSNSDRDVTMAGADIRVDYLLKRVDPTIFSLNGGLFIDTPPLGRRNSEAYANPLGNERVLVDNLGDPESAKEVTNANFPGSYFNSTGLFVPNLTAGEYDVTFVGPDRGAAWFSTFPPTNIHRVTIGPSCSPPNQCSNPDGDGINIDFGISNDPDYQGPWIQSVGGDFRYDHNGFSNPIPLDSGNTCGNESKPFASSNLPNTPPTLMGGIVFTGNNPSFNKTKASPYNWLIEGNSFSAQNNIIKTSYQSVLDTINKSGVSTSFISSVCSNLSNCNLNSFNSKSGIFRTNGRENVTITNGGNISGNKNLIFLIEGDLNINSEFRVAKGSTAVFIVKGSITIASNVENIDGIFSSDKDIIFLGNGLGTDNPLKIEGNIIANADITINSGRIINFRDLGSTQNKRCSTVRAVIRPDFILNLGDLFRTTNYVIKEAAPQGRN